MSVRIIQTRAYLSANGHERLDTALALQRKLYNAALEHRRNTYKAKGDSVSKFAQSRELTDIRAELPEYEAIDRRVSIGTLERLDRAYRAAFDRWKRGESKFGFPRYKGAARFRTIEIYSRANRYMGYNSESGKGRIRIKGLPILRFKSGRIPADQQPKHILITRTPKGVYVSMSFDFEDTPPPADDAPPRSPVGVDVGIAKRATLSSGEMLPRRETTRWERCKRRFQRKMKRQEEAALRDGRAEWVRTGWDSNTKRYKFRLHWIQPSRSYEKTRAAYRRASYREQVRDRNYLHRVSARVVKNYDLIAVEDLNIKNMVRSARGTPTSRARTSRRSEV